jgi:DNA repair photolyase
MLFEPDAPSIWERLATVEELHALGFRVFVMIAPLLPEAKGIVKHLRKNVDYVLIDKMNYHYADWVYRKYGLNHAMTKDFLDEMKGELANALDREKIPYKFLY